MFNYTEAVGFLVQASSSDSSGANKIAFLFLFAGFVFYGIMFLRYRNVNKRHHHESDTKSRTANIQAGDTFVHSRTGVTDSNMPGANNKQFNGKLWGLF
ncbi:MAG: growth/differentiation factor [Nakamurella sp.]